MVNIWVHGGYQWVILNEIILARLDWYSGYLWVMLPDGEPLSKTTCSCTLLINQGWFHQPHIVTSKPTIWCGGIVPDICLSANIRGSCEDHGWDEDRTQDDPRFFDPKAGVPKTSWCISWATIHEKAYQDLSTSTHQYPPVSTSIHQLFGWFPCYLCDIWLHSRYCHDLSLS